jgi:RNA polymerase sigma-70 factor (ECF subfamily)
MTVKSDREIIQAFEIPESKELAFSQLVRKYQERLYWHCRRLLINHEDADDALQNTFMKVWSNLEKFRADSSLYTWLFRIATNESLTILRSNKKHLKDSSNKGEYDSNLADMLESDPYFDGDEAQKKLQKAIQSLPEKQRLVFNMKYYEEMKYKDMAEVLNTSEGALKASYHHAVKKIESFVKAD